MAAPCPAGGTKRMWDQQTSITSHWATSKHMATPICKGTWEILLVFKILLVDLRKEVGRDSANLQYLANIHSLTFMLINWHPITGEKWEEIPTGLDLKNSFHWLFPPRCLGKIERRKHCSLGSEEPLLWPGRTWVARTMENEHDVFPKAAFG